ncbi:hypothetical protein D3C76_1522170 [compost metagenome]
MSIKQEKKKGVLPGGGKDKTATRLPFLVFASSPVGEGRGEGTRPQRLMARASAAPPGDYRSAPLVAITF